MVEVIDGKYEVISKIGSGGTSVVYKARRLSDDKLVAIKLIRDELDDIKEHERHFRHEAEALFQMSHRNIRRIFSIGQWNNSLYMVTEYIDGRTLKDIITEDGPLPQKTAIDYALQIASGIEHAHRKHIIHRDIKPQNVLVSNDGVVKIVDFGIARIISQTTRTMGGKDVVGSVHYISPEQAKGADVDSRTDIYSFGVLLYEMFTGKVPFEGVEAVSIAIKHVNEAPLQPKEVNPDVTDGINGIIMKCMQKNPDLRYQDASELKEDILLYVANPDGFRVENRLPKRVRYGNDGEIDTGKNGSGHGERVSSIAFREKRYGKEDDEWDKAHGKNHIQKEITVDGDDGDDLYGDDNGEDEGSGRRYGRDEDEEEYYKSSGSAFRKVMLIILGVICSLAVISGIVFFVFTQFLNKNTYPTAPVPTVEGLSKNAAVAVLRDNSFSKFTFSEENSSEIDEGSVIRTEPEDGLIVTVDTEIKIVLSSGAKTALAENTVGMTATEAAAKLEAQGFQVKYTYIADETKENGIVTEQSNTSQALAEGSYITLTVVRNIKAESIVVPDLSGCKTIAEAKAKIVEAGFSVGTYREEKVEDTTKLGVWSQYPTAGTEYVYMSGENPPEVEISFTIYVSSGYKCMYEYSTPDGGSISTELIVFDASGDQIAYQKYDSVSHINYIYKSDKIETVTFELYSGSRCIDKKTLTTGSQQVTE